jgi:molybdopterin-guanine dinucleotide biosynthesis protein A
MQVGERRALTESSMRYDGLVVAGGRARRMGGGDKSALLVGGRSMRATALTALAGAERTVVVGPGGDALEDPPGGGPVAALAAGLPLVEAPVVVVLAADLPFVTADAVAVLAARANAVAVDDAGRAQYLLAAYRTADLRAAIPPYPDGCSLRSVIDPLAPALVQLGGDPPPWWDCDTPEQLAFARKWR